ncbi:MAG: nucleotidyltransferase [Clostridiales bacterium]|nr:nucleotidyltransferase [Clostridiales bacterium]
MTLVILAAGMGSRFGGTKQITPLTENNEFIIDFTVYDAVQAGFDKIVFLIREEHKEAFDQTITKRIRQSGVNVEYAFQRPDLPEGFTYPDGRVKPWGTAHAVASLDNVHDNFGVMNADDFYGRETFEKLAAFLKDAKDTDKSHYCLLGYNLKNTLSENGTVSRGICAEDENGMLTTIVENTKIESRGDHAVNVNEDGTETYLSLDSLTSMNCFGFTPSVIKYLKDNFVSFLKDNQSNLVKCEYLLPTTVQKLINQNKCDVKVIPTNAKWKGVTYREDSESFTQFIIQQRKEGLYPSKLWKD